MYQAAWSNGSMDTKEWKEFAINPVKRKRKDGDSIDHMLTMNMYAGGDPSGLNLEDSSDRLR
jgi:hypothetical protein